MTTTTTLKTTKSEEIFAAAQNLMPGGVNSPVRAFKSVGGQPIVFDRVKGAYIWDVDNNQYIDYVGTWGPAICGHAHPEVLSALKDVLEKGTSFWRTLLFGKCVSRNGDQCCTKHRNGTLCQFRNRSVYGSVAVDSGIYRTRQSDQV